MRSGALIGFVALIILIAVLKQKSSPNQANPTSEPGGPIPKHDAYSETISRVRSAVQEKRWDEADDALTNALQIKSSGLEGVAAQNTAVDHILSVEDYSSGQFQKVRSFGESRSSVWSMHFDTSGQLITRHADLQERVWNIYTGELLRQRHVGHGISDDDLESQGEFEKRSSDGSQVATVKRSFPISQISIRNTDTGEVSVKRLVWEDNICISPDLTTVVEIWITGMAPARLVIKNIATGNEIRTITMEHGQYMTARFTPNGNWLVMGCSDGTIQVWGMPGRR
jgi:WD40 repeat protein